MIADIRSKISRDLVPLRFASGIIKTGEIEKMGHEGDACVAPTTIFYISCSPFLLTSTLGYPSSGNKPPLHEVRLPALLLVSQPQILRVRVWKSSKMEKHPPSRKHSTLERTRCNSCQAPGCRCFGSPLMAQPSTMILLLDTRGYSSLRQSPGSTQT